ncbi:MAG: endonuclease domain-containing protein [Alphaproteobacteria bacterium]|nr:endonuclease domain-containing protein [Alphaproteobacteria bacterium]MBV9373314.1 endonuclease domain-containing protein [Alphaproteobacteria bacterium]MBV9900805.1 endonuclease domain-containing protein [Alphaproteobacteria bacterium]
MLPSPISGEGGARPRSGWEGEGRFPTRKALLARAKWMRTHPTEAERRLWTLLRDRRLATFKFRRQQVIEPYIVDFVCFEQRLIIETDGSQHAESEADAARDAFLRRRGFRVLRFWNNDVLGDAEAVATAIAAALRSLTLPPLRGGPLPLPKWERG